MMIQKRIGAMARRRHAKFMARTYGIFQAILKRGPAPVDLECLREIIENVLGRPCAFCGQELTERNFSLDHMLPLSRGGKDESDNYDVICAKCNNAKSVFTSMEFRRLIGALEVLDAEFEIDLFKRHVLTALRVANSFRFGAQRREKEQKAKADS